MDFIACYVLVDIVGFVILRANQLESPAMEDQWRMTSVADQVLLSRFR